MGGRRKRRGGNPGLTVNLGNKTKKRDLKDGVESKVSNPTLMATDPLETERYCGHG